MPDKKPSLMKPVIQVYLIILAIVLAVALVGAVSFMYVSIIQKPDGSFTTSGWPGEFTEQFQQYITADHGNARLTQKGMDLLKENRLWFQLLDENGRPVLSYGTAENMKPAYTPADQLEMFSGKSKDNAVFAGICNLSGVKQAYLIGFPLRISKTYMYLNGDHFTSGRPIVGGVLLTGLLAVVLAGYLYGWYVSRRMKKAAKSMAEIASRAYMPIQEKGIWSEVYASLNRLDSEIRAGDALRDTTDRLRREWIENITHDLKAPLSPIRGFSELLADPERMMNDDDRVRYAKAILKSTDRIERLTGDMKLAYQIDSGIVPVHRERTDVARLMRETVIDILNDPQFQARTIDFACEGGEMEADTDAALLKRAVCNLIINALVHNKPETNVWVTVARNDGITVCVRDDGRGLTQEEQRTLFERYSRGKEAGENSDGSGLGMAIAAQIVLLLGGLMKVQSEYQKGTSVTIILPDS